MLYFIPAWYQQNKWRESEQSWHTRRMHTEFDDTVKQVQMFYRNGMRDFKILFHQHIERLFWRCIMLLINLFIRFYAW